ncbi:TetR/AcrR family transcriptional regulator [Nocardioides taihuensis]|uniref:TetR/AcrR family transcriptional regulator n=1 Tax=Nocardioides taihuensis TaxID=1835606 RepID=A0ABW0BNN0_9ACTN
MTAAPEESLPRTARERARAEITRTIQETARRHLADTGPAGLSLRAIAREVGMVSSAVYRYFPSRDDLLTALIIESYDELGTAVEQAEAAVPERTDLRARFGAIAHAVRGWARAHPHEYALIYGSPVPGYAAPTDTIASATRVPAALLGVATGLAEQEVALGAPPLPVPPAEHEAVAGVQAALESDLDDALMVRSLMAWSTLFGHVSLELFGHMHNAVLDYDTHFAHVVDQLAADLGLRP